MPTNADAADLFREIADLLDLTGERFKPEAYRRAARSIETLTEELATVSARGGLEEIPGVGEAIAEKIRELLATGRIAYLDRLRTSVPGGLLSLMRLPGLGPKTTRRFWLELGVEGPAELQDAIAAGRLTGVAGFGPRKIQQISAALAIAPDAAAAGRRPIESVYPVARSIVDALRAGAPTDQVEIAGSFRRCRETVGDLDLLVTSRSPTTVFDVFSGLPEVAEVRMRGGTKETVVLRNGLQVDLRVVEPEAFGAALQYFTGSKDHNVRLRTLARDAKLKVNEYGVFRGGERVAGRTEEEVYAALGLAWVPPELREDHGEIDAARTRSLPDLVGPADLQGELHVHLPPDADASTVRRIATEAATRHLRYVGVVVGSVGEGGRLETIAPALLAAIRSGEGPVRWLTSIERTPEPVPTTAAALAPDYTILRPVGAGDAPSDGEVGSPALIAHVGGDTARIRPWLDRAAALGAGIEVGPGVDRIDSVAARLALELHIPLVVPTGVGAPERDPTGPVGLGFARRAGASSAQVTNARPWPARPRTAPRPSRSK